MSDESDANDSALPISGQAKNAWKRLLCDDSMVWLAIGQLFNPKPNVEHAFVRTAALYDKDRSVAFYEERYSDHSGYMEEWPIEKKCRVFDVIQSLGLPSKGEAVDYGCGNGVFTDVLRQALAPGWKVYGVDVSEAALERAKSRYPDCAFYLTNDPVSSAQRQHRMEETEKRAQWQRNVSQLHPLNEIGCTSWNHRRSRAPRQASEIVPRDLNLLR